MNKNKKEHNKGIILVLSGGAAKGFAHIGVLEMLIENHIPIKGIIGVSAGALAGGFYCADKLEELKKIVLKITKLKSFELFFARFKESLFNPMKKSLENIEIKDLKLPFIAVAYDLSKDKEVLIKKGNLFKAIRASMAIPLVFNPVKIDNSLLMDGGIRVSLPVNEAIKQFGKNKILAVNVCYSQNKVYKNNKDNKNSLEILHQIIDLQAKKLSIYEEKGADIVIRPEVGDIEYSEFYKAKEAIALGRKAAKKMLPKIRKLIKN